MKKRSHKKSGHRVIKAILWYFTLLFVLLLILTYISSRVSPLTFWPFAFLSLLFPYLLALNIILAVFWAFMKKWRFLVPLGAILIGWGHLSGLFALNDSDSIKNQAQSFKLLSYNVQNLSGNNLGIKDPDIESKILGVIKSESADIVCLQEFHAEKRPRAEYYLDSLKTLFNCQGYSYQSYRPDPEHSLDAIVTFSKFPVLQESYLIDEVKRKFAVITDLATNNGTIRVFNVHLASLYFRQEDYIFLTELDLPQEQENEIQKGLSRVIGKMKKAYQRRARQAIAIREQILASPYPVIVCGDFNDPPLSYSFNKISKEMTDAFKESGKWFGTTYHGRLPAYRIDYMLHDDEFVSSNFEIIKKKYSDHYPVKCYLALTAPNHLR